MATRLPIVVGADGLPQQLQADDVLLTTSSDQASVSVINMATRLIQTQGIVASIVLRGNLL